MVFINEGFPPFFIRKEGDDFIYYRNILDMQISGDSEVDVVSALSGLPFSFYGYGFIPEFWKTLLQIKDRIILTDL